MCFDPIPPQPQYFLSSSSQLQQIPFPQEAPAYFCFCFVAQCILLSLFAQAWLGALNLSKEKLPMPTPLRGSYPYLRH